MILDVDLSQIEWRICAELTQDKVMIEEIKQGIDQHAASCRDLMELEVTKENRGNAKIFNFRAIYAETETAAYAYYMDHNMPNFSQKKWNKVIDGFFNKYSGMVEAHNKWIQEVARNGELVGPTGRRWVFEKNLKKGIYQYSGTKIRNYPVQGSSGDLIKLAIVKIKKRLAKLYPQALMVMTVHDSIIFDVPEHIAHDVARICIDTFEELPALSKKYFNWDIKVPITGEAELGPSWGEMERII